MPGALAIVSFAVAFVSLQLLLSHFGRVALDRPNARSLHEHPVPRTGGIAVLLGLLIGVPFAPTDLWLPLGLALVLAVVSFVDDVRGLPSAVRLAFHLIAAGAVVAYLVLPASWVAIALLAVAVAWMTNLFNFMDGSDGLAGGMALIGFSVYAVAADSAGDAELAAASLAIAGAAAAFLVLNFHPARIFLGDVGSIPLGFLSGALGVLGWRDDVWPLWFPLLVFGVFIGDATLTLLKRLARAERVWQPHRQHYYQRLVQLGAGHRGAALVSYALMLLCGAAALAAREQAPATQVGVAGAAVLALCAAAAWIDVRWARHV
jgi:UDP-N-acetylmuramyl pentapeptide phosphotransferase/UDP-N-acetylglucosamine-1-phosphate transferase